MGDYAAVILSFDQAQADKVRDFMKDEDFRDSAIYPSLGLAFGLAKGYHPGFISEMDPPPGVKITSVKERM